MNTCYIYHNVLTHRANTRLYFWWECAKFWGRSYLISPSGESVCVFWGLSLGRRKRQEEEIYWDCRTSHHTLACSSFDTVYITWLERCTLLPKKAVLRWMSSSHPAALLQDEEAMSGENECMTRGQKDKQNGLLLFDTVCFSEYTSLACISNNFMLNIFSKVP